MRIINIVQMPSARASRDLGRGEKKPSNSYASNIVLPSVPYNYFSKITFRGYPEDLADELLEKASHLVKSTKTDKQEQGYSIIKNVLPFHLDKAGSFLESDDNDIVRAALEGVSNSKHTEEAMALIKPFVQAHERGYVHSYATAFYAALYSRTRGLSEILESISPFDIPNLKRRTYSRDEVKDVNFKKLINSTKTEDRRAAAIIAGKTQAISVNRLKPLLNDTDDDVVYDAIDAIAGYSDEEDTISMLFPLFENENQPFYSNNKTNELLEGKDKRKELSISEYAATVVGQNATKSTLQKLEKMIDRHPELVSIAYKAYFESIGINDGVFI